MKIKLSALFLAAFAVASIAGCKRDGKHGPVKDEPPIDDLVMARMGILGSQPGFRPPPVHVVHPLPTVGAAMLAAQGISAALLAREKTGLGRKVETSLMAGACCLGILGRFSRRRFLKSSTRMPLSPFKATRSTASCEPEVHR